MNKRFWCLSMLLIASQSWAQTTWQEAIENIQVRSIGPAAPSGRVTAIDVDEDVSGAIYIGAASGGVWKSTSGGVTWQPIFDNQPLLGIGSIQIDPINPNYVWVGTGEGNPRNSHTSGGGIFLTMNGGSSWECKGLEATKNIHRIVVDPSDHQTVYAGAFGNVWAPNRDRGVYKSDDLGKSWKNILFVNDTVGCADLIIDPKHPQKLLAAMYHYQRQPYHFQSGGNQSGLYLTNDGGEHWQALGEKQGLPAAPWGRVGLAMAPSNCQVIYALIECKKTGLYKSEDGGLNWHLITTEHINDRPFYYHEIYVDPTNEYHLMYLHSTVSESFDGGKSWSTLLPYWGVHPDHHAFWWSTKNTKHMMEGNDGGFNQTYDGGRNWTFAANLPLSQFYHIHCDMMQPYHVYGGMQDNGSWRGPSRTFNEGGIRDSDWQEVAFGDGFDVVPHPQMPHLVYAMSQGGSLVEVNFETNEERWIKPVHPQNLALRFNWNSGLLVDEANGDLYYGSQFLHKSSDRGASWQIISPDLTSNDSSLYNQSAKTGGLTPDRTSAEMYCSILCIAKKGKHLLVGTDDGKVHRSNDDGGSWQLLSTQIKGLPKTAWISQVHWSRFDDNTLYVVANNYRFDDWKPYLFCSKDGGATWINLAENKNIKGHCLSFVEDIKAEQLLFLGTEHGLWVSLDDGVTWNLWDQNLPRVAVQDLAIHPREGDLIIGTFGRSAYIIDRLEPLRVWSSRTHGWHEKAFELYPIKPYVQHDYKRPVGQRFPADGSFEGDNLARGVALVYFAQLDTVAWMAKQKTMSKSGKNKVDEEKATILPVKQEVKIYIRSLQGDTLRRWTHQPDTALNVVLWNMDTKGWRWPSLNEPKEPLTEPGGGLMVEPGTYQAVVVWGNFKDSAQFEIKSIYPKSAEREQARRAEVSYFAEIEQWAIKANKQMEWLRETERSIGLVKSTLIHVPDSSKKVIMHYSDSLAKCLANIKSIYFLPEDAFGIQDDGDKATSYLWMAMAYADGKSVVPGSNAKYTLEHLKERVEKGILLSQELEKGLLREWQAEYDKLNPKPFKKISLE